MTVGGRQLALAGLWALMLTLGLVAILVWSWVAGLVVTAAVVAGGLYAAI